MTYMTLEPNSVYLLISGTPNEHMRREFGSSRQLLLCPSHLDSFARPKSDESTWN